MSPHPHLTMVAGILALTVAGAVVGVLLDLNRHNKQQAKLIRQYYLRGLF